MTADSGRTTRPLGRETGESVPLRKLRALFDEKQVEEAAFRTYWSYGPPHTSDSPATKAFTLAVSLLLAFSIALLPIMFIADESAPAMLKVVILISVLPLALVLMLMLVRSEVEKWQLRRLRAYYRTAHLSSDAYAGALRLLPSDPAYAEAFHMLVAERLERRSVRPLPPLHTAERTERWVNWVLNPIIFISSCAVLLTGIMVLVSLVALGRWVSNSRTLHWQPVPAYVVVFDPLPCNRGRRSTQFQRKEQGIYYRYQWKGQHYFSNRFANSGDNSTLEDCGEEVIAAMRQNLNYTKPPRRLVTAYVNPDEPSMAVLMRGGGGLDPKNLFSLLFIPTLFLSSWASATADKLSKEQGFD